MHDGNIDQSPSSLLFYVIFVSVCSPPEEMWMLGLLFSLLGKDHSLLLVIIA